MELNLDDERLVKTSIGSAVINSRILATNEIAKIGRRHTKTEVRRGVPVETSDDEGFSRDFWDRTIDSWSGLTAAGGAPIECTRENKFRVVTKYPEIAERIRDDIEAAKKATIEKEADDLKNS